jgi:hypothetical protein
VKTDPLCSSTTLGLRETARIEVGKPCKVNRVIRVMERAMGIEQIRMNQTKALPPAFQFNWSQMELNVKAGTI